MKYKDREPEIYKALCSVFSGSVNFFRDSNQSSCWRESFAPPSTWLFDENLPFENDFGKGLKSVFKV